MPYGQLLQGLSHPARDDCGFSKLGDDDLRRDWLCVAGRTYRDQDLLDISRRWFYFCPVKGGA